MLSGGGVAPSELIDSIERLTDSVPTISRCAGFALCGIFLAPDTKLAAVAVVFGEILIARGVIVV